MKKDKAKGPEKDVFHVDNEQIKGSRKRKKLSGRKNRDQGKQKEAVINKRVRVKANKNTDRNKKI